MPTNLDKEKGKSSIKAMFFLVQKIQYFSSYALWAVFVTCALFTLKIDLEIQRNYFKMISEIKPCVSNRVIGPSQKLSF